MEMEGERVSRTLHRPSVEAHGTRTRISSLVRFLCILASLLPIVGCPANSGAPPVSSDSLQDWDNRVPPLGDTSDLCANCDSSHFVDSDPGDRRVGAKDLEVVDFADARNADDSLTDTVADADGSDISEVQGGDTDLEVTAPFWSDWWDEDVPWNPGICQSFDEGHLPGELADKPCNMLNGSYIMNQHGVFLRQAQRIGGGACDLPACLEGNIEGKFLVRILWRDQAAVSSPYRFCDAEYPESCPWPSPCASHFFPPKQKVYILDIAEKSITFVRNEPEYSELTVSCPWCTSLGLDMVMSEELCVESSVTKGLHPSPTWNDQISYTCWEEPVPGYGSLDVCVMLGITIEAGPLTYDALVEDLMTNDYKSLICFALVDGSCLDLPLGLP